MTLNTHQAKRKIRKYQHVWHNFKYSELLDDIIDNSIIEEIPKKYFEKHAGDYTANKNTIAIWESESTVLIAIKHHEI